MPTIIDLAAQAQPDSASAAAYSTSADVAVAHRLPSRALAAAFAVFLAADGVHPLHSASR